MSAMDGDSSGDGGVTRCVCSQNDDQEGFMVQCERCMVWQHAECIGITADEAEAQEKYYCEQCAPADPIHKRRQVDPAVLGSKRRAQAQAKSEKKRKRPKREPRASPDVEAMDDEESIREDKPLTREERKMRALMESIAKMEERERSKGGTKAGPPQVALPSKGKSRGVDDASEASPRPSTSAAAGPSSNRGMSGLERAYAPHQQNHYHTFRKPAEVEPGRVDTNRLHLRLLSPMYMGKTKWILQAHYGQRRTGSLQDQHLPMSKRVWKSYSPQDDQAAAQPAGLAASSGLATPQRMASQPNTLPSQHMAAAYRPLSAVSPMPSRTSSMPQVAAASSTGSYLLPSPVAPSVPSASPSASRWGGKAPLTAAAPTGTPGVGVNGHRSSPPRNSNFTPQSAAPSNGFSSHRPPMATSSGSTGAYKPTMSSQSPRPGESSDRGSFKGQQHHQPYGRPDSRSPAASPRGFGSGSGFAGARGYGSAATNQRDGNAWAPNPTRDSSAGSGTTTPSRTFGSAAKPWMKDRPRMGGYGR